MSQPLRHYLFAGVAVLAALVGSFSAGRFSAPLKVETRDVERVVFRDKIVTVERVAKVETRIVWRDRVTTKEGTITEREIEKTGAVTTLDTARAEARDVERIKLVEKVVTVRPNWRVGVLIGASFQAPLLPLSGPLVLGATFDYRIAGGLWVGAWTLPQHGAIGAQVSFEF